MSYKLRTAIALLLAAAAVAGFLVSPAASHDVSWINYNCTGEEIVLAAFPNGTTTVHVKIVKGATILVDSDFPVTFVNNEATLPVSADLQGDNNVRTTVTWTADGGGSRVAEKEVVASCSVVTVPGQTVTTTTTVERLVPSPPETNTVEHTVTVAGPTVTTPGVERTITTTVPGKTVIKTRTVTKKVPKIVTRVVKSRPKIITRTKVITRIVPGPERTVTVKVKVPVPVECHHCRPKQAG